MSASPAWFGWPPNPDGSAPPTPSNLPGVIGVAFIGADALYACSLLADGTTPVLSGVTRVSSGHFKIALSNPPTLAYLLQAQNTEDPFSVLQIVQVNSQLFDVFMTNLAGVPQDTTFNLIILDVPTISLGQAPLLNRLGAMPLWAHSLAVQLESSQTAAFRVRRGDTNAEQDIGFLPPDSNGVRFVDIPSLLAFCGSPDTQGFINVVYNAVPGSIYPYISAFNPEQLVCCEGGVALIGSTGNLVARSIPDGVHAYGYTRADALGLSADPDIVLAADFNAFGNFADYNNGLLSIGNSDAYGVGSPGYARVTLGAWIDAVDDFFTFAAYLGGGANFVNAYSTTAYAGAGEGWAQFQRATATLLQGRTSRWNGVAKTVDLSGGNPDATLNMIAPKSFAWGNLGPPSGTADNSPAHGLISNGFVWDIAQLESGDQAIFDAWQALYHA